MNKSYILYPNLTNEEIEVVTGKLPAKEIAAIVGSNYKTFPVNLECNVPSGTPGKFTIDDDEDAEEADDRPMHGQRLLDSAGNSLYVNEHQGLLQGLNQSVMLRTVIPEAKRRSMFPEAFTMGPSLESAVVYQEAEYIFRQAEQRHRGNRQAIGMGEEGLWTRTSFGRWHCSQQMILTAMGRTSFAWSTSRRTRLQQRSRSATSW